MIDEPIKFGDTVYHGDSWWGHGKLVAVSKRLVRLDIGTDQKSHVISLSHKKEPVYYNGKWKAEYEGQWEDFLCTRERIPSEKLLKVT